MNPKKVIMSKSANLPRDVFLYLLSILTLVVSAVSFGIVAFQYINVYIPDVISDPYFSGSSYLGTMRSALATLIIVFPVFLWVSRFLKKDINNFPEKLDLKIRKWLLYLTLFVAALVMIGDLVALLRSFLEGELSQRFILKVTVILFIASSVFVHYLSELKEKSQQFKWIQTLDWTVGIIVLITVIAGFIVAGTPQNQRLVRLDERRVNDLQSIQWQIVNYWQRKQTLPFRLDNLSDPLSGFILPRDPVSGNNYEFRVLDNLKFELCAVFDTSSVSGDSWQGETIGKPVPVGREIPEPFSLWQHDKGKTCFERTIDPDLYPPVKDKGI